MPYGYTDDREMHSLGIQAMKRKIHSIDFIEDRPHTSCMQDKAMKEILNCKNS